MAFDEKAEGKEGVHASMRLFELARLYQAWGKYSQSIEMYEKAFPLADKQNALKTDPIGYAIVLNDYAAVLKKAGFEQKAESVESRSQKIKDANPGVEPKTKIHYYPTKSFLIVATETLHFKNAHISQPLFTRLTLPGFWREIRL
jgi:tetratricopeptide (TPR) repeat protein